MYIDAHSQLRRAVLRAALEQYAAQQLRQIGRVIEETGSAEGQLIQQFDGLRREATDVLDEMDYYERRRQAHPAALSDNTTT